MHKYMLHNAPYILIVPGSTLDKIELKWIGLFLYAIGKNDCKRYAIFISIEDIIMYKH